MNENEKIVIAESASMIVGVYAFSQAEEFPKDPEVQYLWQGEEKGFDECYFIN